MNSADTYSDAIVCSLFLSLCDWLLSPVLVRYALQPLNVIDLVAVAPRLSMKTSECTRHLGKSADRRQCRSWFVWGAILFGIYWSWRQGEQPILMKCWPLVAIKTWYGVAVVLCHGSSWNLWPDSLPLYRERRRSAESVAACSRLSCLDAWHALAAIL